MPFAVCSLYSIGKSLHLAISGNTYFNTSVHYKSIATIWLQQQSTKLLAGRVFLVCMIMFAQWGTFLPYLKEYQHVSNSFDNVFLFSDYSYIYGNSFHFEYCSFNSDQVKLRLTIGNI